MCYTTAVGYAGGFTPNPTYEEVCSGRTGHTEVVLVVFDPERRATSDMLRIFWESHDPTQGMRQGNDVGTQYRSAIYWHRRAQRERRARLARGCSRSELTARRLRRDHDRDRRGAGRSTTPRSITSSTWPKNPNGYCGLGGTGVACPAWIGATASRG